MKKLMIAAAIVCAAALTQASQVSWGFDTVVDQDGNLLAEDPVQSIVLAVSTDSGANWSKVADGEWLIMPDVEISTVSGDYTANYTQFAGNWYTMLLDDGEGNLSKVELAGGGTFDTILKVDTEIASNWKDINTLSSGATAVVNVPEPTSGLLLLLGVAGLALKRRRA